MNVVKPLFATLAVVLVCAPLQASTLVYYDLFDVPLAAPTSVEATEVAAGVAALELTRGPGVNAANLTRGFSADRWHVPDPEDPPPPPSREDSLETGKYYQFGLSVNPGLVASLSTLDMSLRRSALNAPMNMELHASLDGFATEGIIISAFNYFGRTSGTAPSEDPLLEDPFFYMHSDLAGRPNTTTSEGDPIPTIDLSEFSELQNVAGGTEVTFRLYAWGNTSTTATNTFALGRVVGPRIGGVVIPEPSSLALLCSALLVGLALRRGR